MEILLSTSNDIYTVTFDTVGKTIIISGINDFPVDVNSLREVYDATHAGYFGLPNTSQFAWFRANGLPVFVWGVNNLPAGAASGDTLNIMLDISEYQAGLSIAQKQASNVPGLPGTLVTGETPGGAIDGTNKTFTLVAAPITGAVTLAYQAFNSPPRLLIYGVHFTMAGSTITLNNAPPTGSTIFAIYYK